MPSCFALRQVQQKWVAAGRRLSLTDSAGVNVNEKEGGPKPPRKTRAEPGVESTIPAAAGMVNFDQTTFSNAPILLPFSPRSKPVPVPTNDKFRAYSRYAAHCLHQAFMTRDQESRAVFREMAAEWVQLADALSDRRESVFYELRTGVRELEENVSSEPIA